MDRVMDSSQNQCVPLRDSQFLGQAEEEDAIISLVLRKEYCDIDESNDNRLLWKSRVEKVIQTGTLTRLVQHLAPYGELLDHSYRTSFLAVYRTFSTPTELLQELINWFMKVGSGDVDKFKVLEGQNTLRSVLSFIRLWLEKYLVDFNDAPSFSLLIKLEKFLESQIAFPSQTSTETSDLLRHLVEVKQKLVSGNLTSHGNWPVERAIDDLYDWLNFPPAQIACDLTALDAAMFGALIPHECLHYVRNQTSKCSTVHSTIEHFNNVIRLVVTTVMRPNTTRTKSTIQTSISFDDEISMDSSSTTMDSSCSDDLNNRLCSSMPPEPYSSPPHSYSSSSPVLRGRSISHWIDIAQQCRVLKNFSSLKAIVFGLQSSSIVRLEQSWALVSNEKQSMFKELLELFSSESNFQMFRQVVNKEATGKRADVSPHKKTKGTTDMADVVIGIIPYLGTFLSDLTMLHNAIPDKTKDGRINFEKHRKEFEVLAKISLFQTASTKYNLQENPSLYHWIYHTPLLSETESYQTSTDLEPQVPITQQKMATPLCETIFRRSLRLLRHGHKKTTALSVPADPRVRKSYDLDTPEPTDKVLIKRSSSCFELNEDLLVKVSVHGQESTCYYRSIYVNKSDRTSKVIEIALDKYGLSVKNVDKYQLWEQCGAKEKLSLIPDGSCVYYALGTKVNPKLFLKLKES